MTSRTHFTLVAILLTTVFTPIVEARYDVWSTTNGVPVRQGVHLIWDGGAVAGESGWATVWSDARNGELDVYAQHFDADGAVIGSEGGVQVSSGPYGQKDATIAQAGDGSWFVLMNDQREDPEGLGMVIPFMQRLSAEGAPLWTSGPIQVHPTADMWGKPVLVPTSDNAVIFAISNDYQLVVQKIDTDGTKIWGEEGRPLASGFLRPYLVPDGTGGVWLQRVLNVDGAWTLTLQRLDSTGESVWDEPINLSTSQLSFLNQSTFALPDGKLAVVWVEMIGEQTPQTVIKGRIITPEGEDSWTGGEQVLLSSLLVVEKLALTTFEGDLVVGAYGLVAPESWSLRAQRVTVSPGEATLLWDEAGEAQGVTITEEGDQFLGFRIASAGTGVAFAWALEIPGVGARFHLQQLNGSGTPLWTEPSERTLVGHLLQFNLLPTGDDVTLLWSEEEPLRRSLQQVRLDHATGQVVTPEGERTIQSGLARNTFSKQVIRSGASAYVGWIDDRFDVLGRIPFLQRLDLEDGSVHWPGNGINLVPRWPYGTGGREVYYAIEQMRLAATADGGCVAAWIEDASDGSHRSARMQRINESGELLWGDEGVALLPEGSQYELTTSPFYLFTNEEGVSAVLFTALDHQAGYENRPVMQIVDGEGNLVLEGGHPLALTPVGGDRLLVGAVEAADETLFILMQSLDFGSSDLHARRYSYSGEAMLESFVVLPQEPSFLRSFVLRPVGEDVMISWVNGGGMTPGIQWNRIDPQGQLYLGDEGGVLLPDDYGVGAYSIETTDTGFWLAWSDGEVMRYQMYSHEGEPMLMPASGRAIEAAETNFFDPVLIGDGGGGIYIVGASGTCCNELDFSYTHLDGDGNPVSSLYAQEGILPIVDMWYAQRELSIVPDGEGGFLAAWSDNRSAIAEDAYAMRVNDFLTTSAPESEGTITPTTFALLSAYPNPFNPSTTIRFSLPEAGFTNIAIFDILGREVARLLSRHLESGAYTVSWNGTDFARQGVASGVYFVRLDSQGLSTTQRIVLMK